MSNAHALIYPLANIRDFIPVKARQLHLARVLQRIDHQLKGSRFSQVDAAHRWAYL